VHETLVSFYVNIDPALIILNVKESYAADCKVIWRVTTRKLRLCSIYVKSHIRYNTIPVPYGPRHREGDSIPTKESERALRISLSPSTNERIRIFAIYMIGQHLILIWYYWVTTSVKGKLRLK